MKTGESARHDDGGFVLIWVALLLPVLIGMAALVVDVGMWYVTGMQAQKAADAAAMAGVPYLPGNQPAALSMATDTASRNGFTSGAAVTVTPALNSKTQLKVTVSKTVNNLFGTLLGISSTVITKTAVADYLGPVPMGSPCNEFGQDPEAGATQIRSSACAGGQFWAGISTPSAIKTNGDAYQSMICGAADDGCSGAGANNDDYDDDGYFYVVRVTSPLTSGLTIEAFDPALVHVNSICDAEASVTYTSVARDVLAGATAATNPFVSNPATRYAEGISNAYCSGDQYNTNAAPGGTVAKTLFQVRSPGPNAWDPLSYPVMNQSGCTPKTYKGYYGDLKQVLTSGTAEYNASHPDYDNNGADDAPTGYVASVFRRWVPLCTLSGTVPPGDYLVQLKTNGLGTDGAYGHNRFALRAYTSTTNRSLNTPVSVFGLGKMGLYTIDPAANPTFPLARVPTGAGGHILTVSLFDVGDASATGTLQVAAPNGTAYQNCTATGPQSGSLTNCSVTPNKATWDGKWERISVPIPSGYSCNDADPAACWVYLKYNYTAVRDNTSWTVSLDGDPVRLIL